MRIKTCCTVVLAAALLLMSAGGAHATVSVQIAGNTLAVFASEGADTPRFRNYGVDGSGNGHTRIFDPSGVTDIPPECDRNDIHEIPQAPENIAICPNGGAAAPLTTLELTLYGGPDEPAFQACFDAIVIDAGEGANKIVAPNCNGGFVSVIAGSGQDTFWGPDSADPPLSIALAAKLGAGDDSFSQRGGGGASLIHGEAGNDYLVGGYGDDELFGDDGEDWFLGLGGDDRYDGGPGDDRIGQTKGVNNDEDPGNDDYRGGGGSDTLVLDGHPSGMTITIDEAANDGSSGEADNVHNDFESIIGSKKNDVFTGGPGVDKFDGDQGADTIHGGDGNDHVTGGSGDDKVYGDGGADKVEGTTGADTVDGGPGTDQLYGDIAGCSVFCSFDSDLVLARDGEADTVDCGGGADTAQVDGLDIVAFCTVVDRQSVPGAGGPGPGGGGPGAGGAGAGPSFGFTTSALSVARGVGTTVTCPAACSFTVTIVLSAKTARKYGLGRRAITIGTARGALLAAGREKVTVKLSRKAKRKLRRARSVPATLRVSVKDAAGSTTVKTKSVKLGT